MSRGTSRTARAALDYPEIPAGEWVAWVWNGHPWPDARRDVRYLSADRRDVMRGFALFTGHAAGAARFATEAEARVFVADNEAKRPAPYHGLRVTTAAALRAACGYDDAPDFGALTL